MFVQEGPLFVTRTSHKLAGKLYGQSKLSSCLPALDPLKEMAQTLLVGRAETFVVWQSQTLHDQLMRSGTRFLALARSMRVRSLPFRLYFLL